MVGPGLPVGGRRVRDDLVAAVPGLHHQAFGVLAVQHVPRRLSRDRVEQRQAAYAPRVLDRQHLCDHPAHRPARHVGALQAQRVEHPDHVVRHVRQPVTAVEVLGAAELLRQPDVAVVQPDEVEPGVGEERAELLVPADELPAEALDQHQRPAGRVSGRLVVDLDVRRAGEGHVRLSRGCRGGMLRGYGDRTRAAMCRKPRESRRTVPAAQRITCRGCVFVARTMTGW